MKLRLRIKKAFWACFAKFFWLERNYNLTLNCLLSLLSLITLIFLLSLLKIAQKVTRKFQNWVSKESQYHENCHAQTLHHSSRLLSIITSIPFNTDDEIVSHHRTLPIRLGWWIYNQSNLIMHCTYSAH